MGYNERKQVRADAMDRIKKLSFGDKITNVCAGDTNPHRQSFFSEIKTTSRKNRYGIVHKTTTVRCTDGRGGFWDTGIEVIFPGWLEYSECEKLFAPIWEAEYR